MLPFDHWYPIALAGAGTGWLIVGGTFDNVWHGKGKFSVCACVWTWTRTIGNRCCCSKFNTFEHLLSISISMGFDRCFWGQTETTLFDQQAWQAGDTCIV